MVAYIPSSKSFITPIEQAHCTASEQCATNATNCKMTAEQTIQTYFDALTEGDAQQLIVLMSTADHYIKIGTDQDEIVHGGTHASAYYQDHVASTQDFTIQTRYIDVQERDTLAYFCTLQTWHLKWKGTFETLNMRLTGVLEKDHTNWKFVQIHASLGIQE